MTSPIIRVRAQKNRDGTHDLTAYLWKGPEILGRLPLLESRNDVATNELRDARIEALREFVSGLGAGDVPIEVTTDETRTRKETA